MVKSWQLKVESPFCGGEIFRGGASAINKSYIVFLNHFLFWLRGGIGTFQLMLCNHDDNDDKDLVPMYAFLEISDG